MNTLERTSRPEDPEFSALLDELWRTNHHDAGAMLAITQRLAADRRHKNLQHGQLYWERQVRYWEKRIAEGNGYARR